MELANLREVQDATSIALSCIRDEARLLFDSEKSKSEEHASARSTLFNLFKFQSERSQAVSHLVSYGYPWDAEIILRSFYETSAKILFICSAEKQNRAQLIDEFWTTLNAITDRKRAIKSNFAEAVFKPESVDAQIFSFLRDSRVFETEPVTSKGNRKIIEQRWSFTGIVEALSLSSIDGKPLKNFKSLLHVYGIASQLLHADPAAFDLMVDRTLRSEDERKLLEASHICRIFSDQVSLGFICVDALRIMLGADFNDRNKLTNVCKEMLSKAKPIKLAFYKIQESLYAERDLDHAAKK